MKRKADPNRLAVAPFHSCSKREQFARDPQRSDAIGAIRLATAPVGKECIADELIDDAAVFLHEVSRFAEPDAEMLGKVGTRDFFRHGTETANVADQQCDGSNGRGGAIDGASESGFELSRGEILLDLLEAQLIVSDADSRAFAQCCRHHHALVIDEGAVATPEIDELITISVVTPKKSVLTGNEWAAVQANGVVARTSDRARIPKYELERLADARRDLKSGRHKG